MKDPKIIAIVVLSVLVIVFGYIAFKPAPPKIDTTLLEKRISELEGQNAQLVIDIDMQIDKISDFKRQNDSLQILKQKPKYVYIEKSKEIDNANVGSLVNDFTNVFTNNSVK